MLETGCWKQDIFGRIIDCSYAPVTAQTRCQFINLNVTVVLSWEVCGASTSYR